MEKWKKGKIQERRLVCLKKASGCVTIETRPKRGQRGKEMKFLTDMHTHSYPASHDGKNSLKEMLAAAQKKGISFYGISDHFDYDYDLLQMSEEEKRAVCNGNEEENFRNARRLQEDYEGVMNVAVGAEFGYSDKPEVQGRYATTYEKYRPDYVINSVHGGDGIDLARCVFTKGEEEIYAEYLQLVRNSLDAPYPYDIVGHIEYIVRYVPFEERRIDVLRFQAQIDDILLTIIQKGKILEANGATKNLPRISLPSEEILRRYYELGGRNVSYGSDAHSIERIGDKREEIAAMLKKIGFTQLTVPYKGEYIKVEL